MNRDSPPGRALAARLEPVPPRPAVGLERGERYLYGAALVLTGYCLWSMSGILIRSIEQATPWQLVFHRSATMALTLLVASAVIHRGRVVAAFRAAGGLGLIGGACFAASSICYIFSVTHTTVANTTLLAATTPFFAAILGWVVLRERLRLGTCVAMAVTLGGVALMVVEGVESGRTFGNAMALGAAVTFAVLSIALRRGRSVDMTPAMIVGGALAAATAFLLSDGIAVSWHDFALCVAMGTVQLSLPLALIVRGSRHLPAVQLTLFGLAETILNPFWVWLGVGETPGPLTLAGGAVLLAAIVGETLAGARRQPPVATLG